MTQFSYRATDVSGKIFEGKLEAKDFNSVSRRLQEMNYFPLEIIPLKEKFTLSHEFSLKTYLERIRSSDIMNFTIQLATLIDAGIPLDKSLYILEDMAEKQKFKELIRTVKNNVNSGATLADALSRHPKIFSRLYINMVKSGEKGGVLDKILLRLSEFLESSEELKSYVFSAMIYPILLILVGSVAVTILVTVVLPKFTRIFKDMGTALPFSTQILLSISNFIGNYWYFIILFIIIAVTAFRNYISKEEGRYKWDSFKLRLPLFGDLIQKIEISRFARTFGTLIHSGVPILQALAVVKDTLSNRKISSSLVNVYGGIKEGSGIAVPLKSSKIFPSLAIHMIMVGEETGNLENMLLKVADTYEKEVKNSVKRLLSFLEPALILIMALLIGFVIISMVMAIFSVNEIPM